MPEVEALWHEVLAACDLTLIASGTATLEAALFKRPMVIAYRMNRLNWWRMKDKGLLPWVGLPNILAREFLVPELIQHACTPENLAREAEALLADAPRVFVMGGAQLTVDGRPVVASQALTYKGMMLSDVPNAALAFGYTNSSWTLKADLTAGYVCRLLNHMRRHGHAIAVPRLERGVGEQPFLGFTSGYVQRGLPLLPKQGDRSPWQVHQNYLADLILGNSYLSRREYDRAIDYYQHALRNGPNGAVIHLLESKLATCYGVQGRFDEAIYHYQRAIQANPGHASTYSLLGQMQATKGDLPAAAANLRRAVELDPGQPETIFALAQVQQQLGDEADALASFQTLLRLQPDNPDALYAVGVKAVRQGNNRLASDLFTRALRQRATAEAALERARRALQAKVLLRGGQRHARGGVRRVAQGHHQRGGRPFLNQDADAGKALVVAVASDGFQRMGNRHFSIAQGHAIFHRHFQRVEQRGARRQNVVGHVGMPDRLAGTEIPHGHALLHDVRNHQDVRKLVDEGLADGAHARRLQFTEGFAQCNQLRIADRLAADNDHQMFAEPVDVLAPLGEGHRREHHPRVPEHAAEAARLPGAGHARLLPD